MRHLLKAPVGLIGRIFAILLLTVLVEFLVSTLMYERASRFSIRDDEAHRLAEHLVIARKLMAEQPLGARTAMAEELTTGRYEISWHNDFSPTPRISPTLDRMYRQVVEWEPELANTDLWMRLSSPGPNAYVLGGLRLPDNSWIYFRMRGGVGKLHFALERVLIALTPALALIVIGGLLVRQTLLPMRRLARAADKVGTGEEEIVPEAGPSEMRSVIHAFNRMQARIQRLISDRTQALAAVGHDLRTPLARLRLRADGLEDGAIRDALQADVEEMESMVTSLLAYLGGESDIENPVRVDLAVLCASLADDASDHGHDVTYAGPEHLEISVRAVSLKRALQNLIENAIHYAGSAVIRLDRLESSVRIRVEDEGPGIPEESLDAAMQPFVRLDPARARDTVGCGLGLAIVARAVQAEEGGSFRLRNRPLGGLSAEVTLDYPGTSKAV